MRKTLTLALILTVGIALGAIGSQVLNAQQIPVKRTVLLQSDMRGVEGKEGYVVLAQIAPGASTGKHYHPGHEFNYVLEGEGMLEMEGRPPVSLKQGVPLHIDPRVVHNGKNTSTTVPLKVLIFYVLEKGQPIAISVK